MKKMMYFGLAALMLGLLSTACVDPITSVVPEEETPAAVEKTMVFTATLEQGDAETKTALDGLSVVWSAGDEIRIYNSTHLGGEVFTLTSDPGKVEGTFSGPEIGDGPYFAVYPASVAGALAYEAAWTLHINVPASQDYAEASFGKGANISWAMAGTKNDLFFHNVFGAVSFTLKGTAKITEVNLYTRGSDILNGAVTITNLGDSSNPWVNYTAGADSDCLSLDCGTGVTLNEADGVPFVISVPAGAFSEGFFVEFIDDQGKAMIKSAKGSSANVIERGVIRKMPAFDYVPQYKSGFLASDAFAGAWKGVAAAGTLLGREYVDKDLAGQYALIPGTAKSFRFQNWTEGYAITMTPSTGTLTLNASLTMDVKAQGATNGVASQDDLPVKVIKKAGGRSWLYDATNGNGYVITDAMIQ